MRTPFYLGVQSLTLFASALRDVDGDTLRSLLSQDAFGNRDKLDPAKTRLVEEELARRKTADHACLLALMVSLLGWMIVLLGS